jgi:hypothetical protein
MKSALLAIVTAYKLKRKRCFRVLVTSDMDTEKLMLSIDTFCLS